MIYPKPKSKDIENDMHRVSYELEKEGLIAFFRGQKYDEKYLNEFLINSLKSDFKKELKDDGLIK